MFSVQRFDTFKVYVKEISLVVPIYFVRVVLMLNCLRIIYSLYLSKLRIRITNELEIIIVLLIS